MKIICDDKIPYISDTLDALADEVSYLPGSRITAEDVKDADALIVRTRTRCDEALLKGSRVSFIATATIGFDHIDTAYCEREGIFWTNCPGCNADSVDQYVRECLKLLISDRRVSTAEGKNRLAVVGFGNVGKRVAKTAAALGFEVFVSDPPLFGEGLREFKEIRDFKDPKDLKDLNDPKTLPGSSQLLPTLPNPSQPFPTLPACDIITFHTPLTFDGAHKTFHLADEAFFRSLKNRPVIINSARGEVVDNLALLAALDEGLVSEAVLDVWENEPDILLPLMEKAYIATPHIAGYSANGKVNADNMVVEALCRHFSLPLPAKILPPSAPSPSAAKYNPRDDHNRFVANPSDFEKLRGDYPVRLE